LYIFKTYLCTDHQHCELFGQAINWENHDVERLLHKLILEGYLKEEIISSESNVINTYIQIGPNADKLLAGLVKVKQ